ncbi:MAG: 30S ribosomal protein S7 [Chloroflexi bacterium RBG_16_54_11]|nr:MAG: 30S ribosomal protein S7 [Chloroflexi bacterium RBG_16_54_11]
MSRRSKPEKHVIPADVRYNSEHVQNFINRVIRKGKRSVATTIVYDAMEMVEERTKRNALEIFDLAIKNVSPVLEVKPRRVGGATYQIPMEVPPYRRFALASRWILQSAQARSGKSFSEKLAGELVDAANNTGAAIRKREETHKMAEANRAFSHFRA